MSGTRSVSEALGEMRREVDTQIRQFLDAMQPRMPDLDHPGFGRLYQSVYAYLRNGGGRMHALSMILAYRAPRRAPPADILPVAVGFQLYHHHTMVHDDIYDEDAFRRGSPTVHHSFRDWFVRRIGAVAAEPAATPHGLFSDAGARKGAVAGWMQGKVVHALAMDAIAGAPFPKDRLFDVLCALNWHNVHDNAGQFKDVFHERAEIVSPAHSLSIAMSKTGRLFGVGADAAAMLGGAAPAQRERLRRWAGHIGTAYQLQDDLEDIEADSEKGRGRGTGTDLRTGKPTLLLALALEMAGAADRRRLESLLQPGAGGLPVEEYAGIVERSGARAACCTEVERLLREAREELVQAQPQLHPADIELMDGFGHYFLSREYWRRQVPPRFDLFDGGMEALSPAGAGA